MGGIWISAAAIARFVVAGSLMTLMAGGQSAPKAARTIVEQTSLFRVTLASPQFEVVRDVMKTLISHADLGIWEQN